MKTINLNVYRIDELAGKAREYAIERVGREVIECYTWYDTNIDEWVERLAEYGFYGANIEFSGFYSQGDGAPPELREFIRGVHFDYFSGCLPNDWIYRKIYDAFFEMQELDTDDAERLIDEIEGDPYNSQLLEWAAESYADGFLNDQMEELHFLNFYELIGTAQTYAIRIIYHEVLEYLQDQKNIDLNMDI